MQSKVEIEYRRKGRKMKNIIKRIVSVFVVLAMTITSINYMPKTAVQAATDEAAPVYEEITDESAYTWKTLGTAQDCSKWIFTTDYIGSSGKLGGGGDTIKANAAKLTYGKDSTVEGEVIAISGLDGEMQKYIKSAWINGVKITSPAKYFHSQVNKDVITFAKSEFDLGDNESQIFYITLRMEKDGVITDKTIAVKGMPEQAPNIGNVELPAIDGWEQINGKGGCTVTGSMNQFYIPANTDNVVSHDVLGIYENGIKIPYAGGNNNTVNEPAFGFSTGKGNMKTVWVDGVKLIDSNKYYINANVITIAYDVFSMSENETEKIFYVSMRKDSGDYTFPLKVVKGSEKAEEVSELAITNADGVDEIYWQAVKGASSYKITYIADEEIRNVETTELAYTFKDNEGNNIYPDNDTEVTVQAMDTAGNNVGDIKTVKAQADMIVTNVVPPEAAITGEKATVTVEYKNIGTAKASFKTGQTWYAVMVKNSEGKEYVSKKNILLPGESSSADVEVDWLTTPGINKLEAEIDEGNRIAESNENNNKLSFEMSVLSEEAVTLEFMSDITVVNSNVKAIWDKVDDAVGYTFEYISDNQNKVDNIALDAGYLKQTEDGSKYYCGVGTPMDNNTMFKIYAVLTGGTRRLVGMKKAQADLVVDFVTEPVSSNGVNEIRVGYTFSVNAVIKNQGTAQVLPKAEGASFEEGYAKHTICAAVTWVDSEGKNQWVVNDSYTGGLLPGASVSRELKGIKPTVSGEDIPYTYWADNFGNSKNSNVVQFINESREDNNVTVVDYNVEAFRQNKEMEWTRLVYSGSSDMPAGTIYPFPVANGSQTAYIDYKVIDTNVTTMDYKDIVKKYVGYAGANMTINFNNDAGKFINYYTKENDKTNYSNTKLEFAQIPGYDENDDEASIASARWINLATQGCTIETTDNAGNPITIPSDGSRSPVGYNGNGINFYVGNFGLYKYYATRFTTPDGNNITIAYRVTDDKPHTGLWQQALAGDHVSDPNALPIYYCGANPMLENDAYNDNDNGKHYETTGALWYDATDIMLSSISIYNGNWLAVATSQYAQFAKNSEDGTKNWKVSIARAETDKDSNFVGVDGEWYDVDPNTEGTHVGIQGTNTVHIGLPWLIDKVPVHSGKGGEKDIEFYWLRIYMNVDNQDEFIEIPVAIYADIPQIQPAQNVTAQIVRDDYDDTLDFMVSWGTRPEQDKYGYTYKVFIGDTQIDDNVYTSGQTVTYEYDLSEKNQELLKANNNQVTVKAYWCEQEIATYATVSPEKEEGWYPLNGDSHIGIQAGQSRPTEVSGDISFYYDRGTNHSNGIVGYNGFYVSINGNKRYFNENSQVYVTRGFTSRDDIKAKYDELHNAIKNPEAEVSEPEFSEAVIEYNYIGGQLQIDAKDLMTADHITTWYLIKVETPETDREGNPVLNEDGTQKMLVTYLMTESVVQVTGNVQIRGYQINTDATTGAVSEYGPSFRVVSRASKITSLMKDGDTPDNPSVQAIIKQGTIYGMKGTVSADDMNISYDINTDEITTLGANTYQIVATEEKGIITGWTGSRDDADREEYNYYAVTFKARQYSLISLTAEYMMKAYAITEDGKIMYEKPDETAIKETSIEQIAENLYTNCRMPNEASHNYLYDNVLNVIAISENRANIANEILKALKITSKADERYNYVNAMYRDMYYYTYLSGEYEYPSYIDRKQFTSKTLFDGVENETLLLKVLNDAAEDVTYSSVTDWIEQNVHTNGLYIRRAYSTDEDVMIEACILE